jgi:hypothetical protein
MAVYQLDEVANTTLDGDGNGQVTFSPRTSRQVWNVTNVAVAGSSVTSVPIAVVYLGSTNLGGTYSGTNDSDNVTAMVWPGQQLSVKWTGGDPGASASAYVYGTISTTGST